ncbi:hypothetical protein LIA77_00122 [Sarocladium implicatum]|nr:hypothetical protein LIA77_00122 [Sarocladium implicatum]
MEGSNVQALSGGDELIACRWVVRASSRTECQTYVETCLGLGDLHNDSVVTSGMGSVSCLAAFARLSPARNGASRKDERKRACMYNVRRVLRVGDHEFEAGSCLGVLTISGFLLGLHEVPGSRVPYLYFDPLAALLILLELSISRGIRIGASGQTLILGA